MSIAFARGVTDRTTIHPRQDSRTYADHGATTHVFHDLNAFLPGSLGVCSMRTFIFADRFEGPFLLSGEFTISLDGCAIRLKNVIFIPKLGYNLVSTVQMADNRIPSYFRRFDVRLKFEDSGTFIGRGCRCGNSAIYTLPTSKTINVVASARPADASDSNLWHRQQFHINFQTLANVQKFADEMPKRFCSRDVF